MRGKLTLVTAMVLAVGVAGQANAQALTFDPITTRQAGLDLLAGTLAGVKTVVTANGDVKALEAPGNAIRKWGAQFPTLFPVGSDKGVTKAAPAIWTDFGGFQKAAMRLSAAGGTLAAAAKAGDVTAVGAALKEVGDACGACHKDYRLK
jgi:cytochrome c556